MIPKPILLLIFILLGLHTQSPAQSQGAMNSSAENQLKVSEQKMDSVYAAILNRYAANPELIASLKKAQKAGVDFREAHVESVYPGENKSVTYGSVYPLCATNLITRLTDQRIQQLQLWLQGTEEHGRGPKYSRRLIVLQTA